MWNELTFWWNELTILWNDLTIVWNDLTWNDLTMERNDRIPSGFVLMTQGRKDHQQRIPNQSTYIYG